MIAVLALAAWPLVMLVLFRRYTAPVALCAGLLGGYLLLPGAPALDLPLLPVIDKASIPVLVAALIVLAGGGRPSAAGQLPGWIPAGWLERILLAMLLVGAFGTVLTNGERLAYGPVVLGGLRLYDAFSALLNTAVLLLPLLLGRKILADPAAHRVLLVCLAASAIAYALPVLYEVRMSPQLNRMVYGYATNWFMVQRGGGWRPQVFLPHGLYLAIFLACAVIAAAGCFRSAPPHRRAVWGAATAGLFGLLVLDNSLGALMIAVLLLPVALLAGIRGQLLAAAIIAGAVLTYPMLRGADLIPLRQVTEFASSIDAGRAGSFAFRLENEDILLEKAREKPLFGWGGWGRARVYDSSGDDLSITDGYWIITLGEGGWSRYIGEFGLLTLPLMLLARRRRSLDLSMATAGLGLVLAAGLMDVIPNGQPAGFTWLIAGALIGRLERGRIPAAAGQQAADRSRRRAEPPLPAEPAAARYTRQTEIRHRRSLKS